MTPLIAKKEIAQQRYNSCKECSNFTSVKLCKLCNCFMPVKVKFAMVACPIGRWLPAKDITQQQADPYKDLE